jgi:uncharacterized protein (DUF362 family)
VILAAVWRDKLEPMKRRNFLKLAAAAPALPAGLAEGASPVEDDIPQYHIVTPYKAEGKMGMPGLYPGRTVTVHAEKCIEEASEKVDAPTVKQMIASGMTNLTGDREARDSWARFFNSADVVGVKVNCSGAPGAMSMPDVVAEICRNLMTVGVKPENIYIHERNEGQMKAANYPAFIPKGVQVVAVRQLLGWDPGVYCEVQFFNEEDTRSFMARYITERFTKIVNVPNMKDHGASGVTGCVKNIAYGSFGNVDRSHYKAKTNTRTYIGTLANVEPLRSRTVLHIMDGLRGVWHAGPFSPDRRFRFYPKQMKFGTDPVAIDRELIDVIDNQRRAKGAISVWERSEKYYREDRKYWEKDPNINRFIREPGHIEYAGRLGLGVYDLQKIQAKKITL